MSVVCDQLQYNDIEVVVSNLWERGWKEAQAYGFTSLPQVVSRLSKLSDEYGYVLSNGFKPFAVFGANKTAEGTYTTWLVATNEFTKVATRATILIAKCIDREMAKRPDIKALKLLSACDYPDVEKWFNLIGFEKVKSNPPFTEYVYSQKAFDLLAKRRHGVGG